MHPNLCTFIHEIAEIESFIIKIQPFPKVILDASRYIWENQYEVTTVRRKGKQIKIMVCLPSDGYDAPCHHICHKMEPTQMKDHNGGM